MKIVPSRKYHPNGSLPTNGEIFVYGSNLAGIHGVGAALIAKNKYGAMIGNGIGRCGDSYGIPTKDENIKLLQRHQIVYGINEFIYYTYLHPELTFFVTAIGCGLAGIEDSTIAPLFAVAINCSFPDNWQLYLENV